MPRLITKFKYMKPGRNGSRIGGYAKYIATREGVEKIYDSQRHAPATIKQQELILRILRDFPDAKENHEYEDYRREKTVGNATEFITRALEENMDRVTDSKTYADYIATRPRAERFGTHGLFTDDGVQVQLNKVSQELNEYTGHVYTTILSLRREDAVRLGFDNGSRWRDFLRSQTQTIAENLKIPMEHLRWYAAFHDEGHHPHIHMIAYSSVPGEGHLSKQGVEKMRSTFARDIFAQDLLHTYEQQTEYRDLLREQGRESVAEIVAQINAGNYRNSKVEALLVQLSERLSHTTGKKVYGYLKADVKAIVDEIVTELATDERIQRLYDLWYDQRKDVLRTYTDHFPERLPLTQNKEFKPIRNAVIQEAMKIVTGIQQAAELEPQQDVWDTGLPAGSEPDMETVADSGYWMERFRPQFTEQSAEKVEVNSMYFEPENQPAHYGSDSRVWWSDIYKQARAYLYGTKVDKPDFQQAMPLLLTEANRGNGYACYDLGRMHQQGLGCEENEEEAQRWFTMALEAFRNAEQTAKKPGYLRYRIGKCYAYGHGTEQNYEESARWFQRAVEENNPFAAYSLGGQYLRGQGVEQSNTEAYSLFIMAAEQGNAYAQYQLGRMYKVGIGAEVDLEKSKLWYAKAYAGFLRMEETMADDKLYYRLGSMNMTGTGTEMDLEQVEMYFQKAIELGNADALYGMGKLYLKAEFHGYDPHKAVEYLAQAAENGNSFAEYQLGKIYYFGNGIRADTKKGLEYLRSAATHGNEYAANLLQAIQHQQTAGVAQCTASLIAQLGRMFQEQEQKQSQRQSQRMDRKLRREIQEKKQAMGLKD